MANRGLGFIGFCLLVGWVILWLSLLWRFRVLYKDRFEYISVAYSPLKLATVMWMLLWAFWWSVLGEVWWFTDATNATVSMLYTFFVDGLCRPCALALVCLLWSQPLSDHVPLVSLVNVDQNQQDEASRRANDGSPLREAAHGYSLSNDSQESQSVAGGSGTGQLPSSMQSPTMLGGGGAAVDDNANMNRSRNTFSPGASLTMSSVAAVASMGNVPMDERNGAAANGPPAAATVSTASMLGAGILNYLGVARDFIIGESHGSGLGQENRQQAPWEVVARWRIVVQSRWIVMVMICYCGLFIAMLVWEASRPVVSCRLLEAPESGACILYVAPDHQALIRPRVFTVITLFCHSILFVALVLSGLAQHHRLLHAESRRLFQRLLLLVLLCEALVIFALWCRIFDRVRYQPAVAFFAFMEDVACQAQLWLLGRHMMTAAKRQPSGRVADWLRMMRWETRTRVTECLRDVKSRLKKSPCGCCFRRRDEAYMTSNAELDDIVVSSPPTAISRTSSGGGGGETRRGGALDEEAGTTRDMLGPWHATAPPASIVDSSRQGQNEMRVEGSCMGNSLATTSAAEPLALETTREFVPPSG